MSSDSSETKGTKMYTLSEDRIRVLEQEIKNQGLVVMNGLSATRIAVQEQSLKYDKTFERAISVIEEYSRDVKNLSTTVVNSAVGKDHIPKDVVKMIVRTMGAVILFLTAALIFIAAGIQSGWLPNFHTIKQNQQDIRDLQTEIDKK